MSTQPNHFEVAKSLSEELRPIDVGGIHRSTRDQILPKYPIGIRIHLATEYLETARTRVPELPGWSREQWMNADRQLRSQDGTLRRGRFLLSFDADELRLKARRCASACLLLMRNKDAESGYREAAEFASDQSVEPPSTDNERCTLEGCRRRLADPSWWRRKIKTTVYQRSETVERELGLVQATTGLYASDDAVTRRQQDKARSRAFLEECIAVNDLGESITLAEIADANVSCPKIRRAEFMTRISGCEEYANRNGHAASFLTLTTPSRFHSHRRNATLNHRWDMSTPADAQKWLLQTWARIRANLDRLCLVVYGFRVAEPHHDGTPHWHMILFHEPDQGVALTRIFERYMLAESPDEPGAKQHRFKLLAIDPSRGSATGYFAKYVSKNIDGYSVGTDLEDTENLYGADETVVRVEAWASLWHIRQFQQIGGPPVGVWRELRRVDYPLSGIFEAARQSADKGDWCGFMEAMGGHQTPFRSQLIKILRVWFDKPGIYGDPIGLIVTGIDCDGEPITTRTREWRIEYIPQIQASRTCVNNCTGHHSLFFNSNVNSSPREGHQWLSDSS